METHETRFPGQYSWVIGLALLSLLVPLAAIGLRNEPRVPFADPARVSYYRQTVAALVLGIACAVGAFIGTRRLMPASLRWLGVGLATLGLLISAYLIATLMGTCGPQVVLGQCNP